MGSTLTLPLGPVQRGFDVTLDRDRVSSAFPTDIIRQAEICQVGRRHRARRTALRVPN